MSNDFIQAADNARRLLQGFAAVQQVADAFDKVGMLQQAESEAGAALVKHRAGIVDAQAKVAELQAQIGVLEAETQVERDKAAKVMADTQAFAAQLLAQAQKDADEIGVNTRTLLAEEVNKAQEAVKIAKADHDAFAKETETLQAKLDKLKAQATKLLG